VVFFIADRAGLKPAPVIELRDLKKSWLDITIHFGLSPEIYYVPVTVDPGPPYGKAYGYFKKHRATSGSRSSFPMLRSSI